MVAQVAAVRVAPWVVAQVVSQVAAVAVAKRVAKRVLAVPGVATAAVAAVRE